MMTYPTITNVNFDCSDCISIFVFVSNIQMNKPILEPVTLNPIAAAFRKQSNLLDNP